MTDVHEFVAGVSRCLTLPADQVDTNLDYADRAAIVERIEQINRLAWDGDQEALYCQQYLLARIYGLSMVITQESTAEGSVVVHEVQRLLERATMAAEDRWISPGVLESAPTEPKAYLSWLKGLARSHRVFKHPYYGDFIRNRATREDLRDYVIQESVVDGRFDDLLALMQVGTSGAAKLEIAANFWDEMGNGKPEEVHTHLFNKIFDVFDITEDDLDSGLTANALLSGNMAVLVSRYRHLYPEAVGILGMTEWLVPDRFVQVVAGWERLGLPDVGIVYHRLHITVDSLHAAGWFHNIVIPAAESEFMRRGIARGTLWRLNSSARYLDERMPQPEAVAR